MSEGQVTVAELAEKADKYLHDTSLTPEEYEALSRVLLNSLQFSQLRRPILSLVAMDDLKSDVFSW